MTSPRLSIADCNVRRVVIEESVPFSVPTSFEIGPCLRAIDNPRRFAPSVKSALIEYFELEDVIFDGQTGAIFKDGVHVHETRYSTQPSHTFNVDSSRVVKQEDPSLLLIGFHAWHHNYYHWLTQSIPSLSWGLRLCDPTKSFLALPALNAFQEHALKLSGVPNVRRSLVDPHKQYEVARLVYTTFTQGASTYRPSAKAVEVFREMRSRVYPAPATADSVVYVSREDTRVRSMANEGELTAMLKKEGVEIVIPTQLSLEEQIGRFYTAKAVIGPHGAGLTNIIFCQPGATLYEIMSDRKPNACYATLAQSMGMNYRAEAFRSDPAEGSEKWCADLQEVVSAARELMKVPSFQVPLESPNGNSTPQVPSKPQ